eukprot:CAMPEP_0178404192 /NCGR_PEP_ID=MMETSP0689_2-20121128/17753_1 /TAXON_ID=160604 /ORGANISM="Amphidinium massartii, Strain CS-259" /LENGTH=317 /DNA_ID=CAMNT_0020025161 /DNA_START=61 /DNA_END=1011 /DNA_ORIENTATION=-
MFSTSSWQGTACRVWRFSADAGSISRDGGPSKTWSTSSHNCRSWYDTARGKALLPGVIAGTATWLRCSSSRQRCTRQLRNAGGRGGEDPWEVLGVPRSATKAEIKKAFRKKALKEHPDVSKAPDAKERWQRVSAAYEVLSSPEKRAKLEQEEAAQQSSYSSSASSSSASSRKQASYSSYSSSSTSNPFRGSAPNFKDAERFATGAGKIGRMALEELLQKLEGLQNAAQNLRNATDAAVGPLQTELVQAEKEVAVLEELGSRLLVEDKSLYKVVEGMQRAGNKQGEIEAIRRLLDLRERRKRVRERIVRCYKNIDYFR